MCTIDIDDRYPSDWDCIEDEAIDFECSHMSTRVGEGSFCQIYQLETSIRDNHRLSLPVYSRPRSHVAIEKICGSEPEDDFEDDWDLDDDGLLQTISPDTIVSQTASSNLSTFPLTCRVALPKAPAVRNPAKDDFDAVIDEDAMDFEMVAMSEGLSDYAWSPQIRKSGNSCGRLPAQLYPKPIEPVLSDLEHRYAAPIRGSADPSLVREFSPVPGLSSSTIVLVCFRTAVTRAAGCSAARSPVRDVIIELFARVRSSSRSLIPVCDHTTTGPREATVRHVQNFELLDLYDDAEAPLKATHERWHGSDLGDEDTRPFLEAQESPAGPILCRALGRVVRERKGWVFELISIWQTEWEDVEWVRGIVCA